MPIAHLSDEALDAFSKILRREARAAHDRAKKLKEEAQQVEAVAKACEVAAEAVAYYSDDLDEPASLVELASVKGQKIAEAKRLRSEAEGLDWVADTLCAKSDRLDERTRVSELRLEPLKVAA